MAQRPAGKKQQTSGKTNPSTSSGAGSARAKAGAKPAAGRQSVAAARKGATNNRTQLIIAGVAIALITAIVVIGVVMNKKNTELKGTAGYQAKTATATVTNGVVSVASGDPAVTIDVFADAMCPACASFEQQFGKQMMEFADQGKVRINYHLLDFLNQTSSSKNYSSRAAAALLAVAKDAGNEPGLVLRFHELLFAPEHQPRERGGSDLTNEQLGELAKLAGASTEVQATVASGKYLAEAQANAQASMKALQAAVGDVRTPSILYDGKPVQINSGAWLTDLIGG